MKRGMEKWLPLEDSLIDQVRDHPILYRCNAKSYKHMLTKENTWKDIAASLGITRRDCKLKWKGIRDGYRRNKILELNGKANRKSKYSDDRLKFLGTTVKSSKESEPLKEEPPEEETPQEYPEPEITIDEQPKPIEPPSVTYERDLLLEELRKGREERYELMRLMGSIGMQQAQGESVTHSFFKSMADVVCGFPAPAVAAVRMRVCRLVSEAEIQLMSECSPADQLELSLGGDAPGAAASVSAASVAAACVSVASAAERASRKQQFGAPDIPLYDATRR